MEIERILLPVAAVSFFVLVLVFPVIRHLRRTGATGIAPLTTKDPRQRVIGLVLAFVLAGLAAFVAAFAWKGPGAVFATIPPPAVRIAGWLVVTTGFTMIVIAQAQMGREWRIGIDEAPTQLVTRGLFTVVRHPIFASMLLGLAGLVLVAPSPLSLLIWVIAWAAIRVEVGMEESHLVRLHGEAYRAYQQRVGRFLPRATSR